MIQIGSKDDFSKLLFLSDMYRNVLDVEGDIIHIAPTASQDMDTWRLLKDIYESNGSRRIRCIPPATHLAEGERVGDRLLAYVDERPPVIALAYFDECDGNDTKACLEIVLPYLTRGSIVAFSMKHGHTSAIVDVIGIGSVNLTHWHPSRTDCYAVI